MPKYYKVKPEFDGRVIRYLVPDGRKRNGYRQEEIELVGFELLSPKKYEQITRFKPNLYDVFEEVHVNIYSVYRSFGVLFHFNDMDEICGEYWSMRLQLQAKFNLIYYAATYSYPTQKITDWLSIETLEFAIKYYESKISKPSIEELISISATDEDLMSCEKEEITND